MPQSFIIFLGALCLLQVAIALWTGQAKWALSTPAATRKNSPRKFWAHIIVCSIVGVAILLFGLLR